VTLPAREASACHLGEQIGRVMFSLLSIGIDIPLTVHDVAAERSSSLYAGTEIVVAGGLMAGSIALAIPRTCEEGGDDYPTSSTGERRFMIGLAVWNAALVAHGVYVLVKPRRGQAQPQPTLVLAPLALESIDGAAAGIGLAGRF
jgi:hypothetical protein